MLPPVYMSKRFLFVASRVNYDVASSLKGAIYFKDRYLASAILYAFKLIMKKIIDKNIRKHNLKDFVITKFQ